MRRCFVFLLGVFVASLAAAGELPTAAPAEVGMSAEKLERIRPAVERFVQEQQFAGVVTAVVRKGKVVYFDAVGQRDIAAAAAMERHTICRIYSMTKPITSVAAMMLYEEGKIGLDDPVSKFVPEFSGIKVFVRAAGDQLELEEPKRPMTVRDLLRHTSGLTYGIFGDTPVDQAYRKAGVLSPLDDLGGLAKKVGGIPLLYQPGTRFNYSVSTDVLGHVVERVSGKRLDEFFAERIFTPLDMKDTAFYVPESKLPRLATNYSGAAEGGLRPTDAAEQSTFRFRPRFLSGGGGLTSTARDYLHLCQMLLDRGEFDGKRLLRPETVQMMVTNQLPKEAYPFTIGGIERTGVGFGFGFSSIVEPIPFAPHVPVGEFGWGGAASTHFWISPKHELAVVVLAQCTPFTLRLENAVKPLVYDAVQK